ncbi:MAG TPA: hypothetical protein DCP36_05210 [Sporomusaceae bacterium]|nr:hypothetical protein [Sporomusaceae bacterium]
MLGEIPKETTGDYVHAIMKGEISSIPLVGGPAAELFGLIIAPPISKRRDEWFSLLGQELNRLSNEIDKFNLDKLVHNEAFITTILHATQIALRNHQMEKLIALRNAVINSAVQETADEGLNTYFLSVVDNLTEWHLRILILLDNPREWFIKNGREVPHVHRGPIAVIVLKAFEEKPPEFGGLIEQIGKDLFSRGLLGIESLNTIMTGEGLLQSRTTAHGKRFIRFLTV